MSEPDHDPFAAFESDRTIIKPSGNRARAEPGAPASAAPTSASASAGQPRAASFDGGPPGLVGFADLPDHASLNPLVQAAAPLLAAAPRLRAMPRQPNPQALRASLGEAIKRFESAARAQNLPNEQVVAARYILCTLLDESASSTPWGGAGAWGAQSLLVQFHNESWGGEKVFQLLTRLAESPAQHRNLLELVYMAMSLGFEGRYKVLDNGHAQLDSVRERLAQMLRQLSGPAERTLSTQWQGVQEAPKRLRDGIAPWVVAVAAALLLLIIFIAMRLSLSAQTDQAFSALHGLQAKAVAAAPPPPVAASPAPRLTQLLQADIDAGAVQVKDFADRSVVTVLGDTMFDSGSADVVARATPLFGRIAAALNQVPGRILISGHSDNQAIRSLRFQSNWHLSMARAQSARSLLAATVAPERLTAEGRADTEPVADNGSAEGRARNRRVEIALTVAAPD
ncbi:type VI secretion system protein TssL, long form [Roseateles oligotrophus]|uniref:Type VI secretion system protein TssL, long form n=1 Tax=Roseateles oligotrophus TaxID=1769250 RepID=A0ABT2YG50_9BURK|nr:type VI secretion system protein TssL, long form [Roseateles oligotrophus]MCV2369036.1 type VI secretion system protein TssL, long form [Roseateles oligotrophus]